MAIQKLSFTGAAGAAATIANTGYTEIVVTDGGGSLIFDDSWKPRGKVCLLATGTSSPGYVKGKLDFAAATDALAFEQPIKPVALPASEATLFFFGNGETRQVSVNVEPGGVVQVRGRASPGSVIWRSTAGALAVGVPVILAVYFTRHPTAGTVRVVVFEEDGLRFAVTRVC